jgi:hypothetical protein
MAQNTKASYTEKVGALSRPLGRPERLSIKEIYNFIVSRARPTKEK